VALRPPLSGCAFVEESTTDLRRATQSVKQRSYEGTVSYRLRSARLWVEHSPRPSIWV
jgi:hypothetical protein